MRPPLLRPAPPPASREAEPVPPAGCEPAGDEPAGGEPAGAARGAPAPGAHRLTVPETAAGERLDVHLAARFDVARNRVRRWVDEGRVRVGGRPAKASRALAAGDVVECEVPPPAPDDRVEPEPGDLRLLHDDPHLLVLDKPAGLTVHPGAGRASGTLVHRLLHAYPELAGVGGPGRPGIVHRLDKDTSGALVVARTAAAHRTLARAFAARRVDKRYLAIVHGRPAADGAVAAPIGRDPNDRKRMTMRSGGRPARTTWHVLATAPGAALLEVAIETGRTHQIRVHLKHARHPLVGDPVYGEARWKALPGSRAQAALRAFPRPALHAWRLGFRHPASGEEVRFEAPVPDDLRTLWRAVGGLWPEEVAGGVAPTRVDSPREEEEER
jgi:23S rRNA pseudouridine1911/1915/1917 synthase